MKRINAQWVFLIILALWIPVLCFADDTAQDKVAHLQHMEQLKAGVYEQKQVQEKIDSNPTIPMKIYSVGLIIFAGLGAALILGITVSVLWESIKFNYYLYVTNGTFCFLKTEQ